MQVDCISGITHSSKGEMMKQRYVLSKNEEKQTLTISEYTELEKNEFSLICEESHASADIRDAIKQGVAELISTFRTHNMYPRMKYAEEMARQIQSLYQSSKDETIELMFDDKDAFIGSGRGTEPLLEDPESEKISEAAWGVDDGADLLLEDDEGILIDDTEIDAPEDEE
jgi:hypothetical protein